jgi:hypothetical protein
MSAPETTVRDRSSRRRRPPRDPRYYQIAVLGSLLLYGVTALRLPVTAAGAAAILGAALATQWAATRWLTARGARLPGLGALGFDPRSALISGLSLCLLLRTGSPLLAALAAVLAVGSKFVLRRHGKHLFNPTNFALVAITLATPAAWVSPGQWGHAAWVALAVGGAGVLVVSRAGRADVTLAVLACHALLLFGRAWYLGDPWAIPLHRLQSTALLIFAFFMISDPKTTPDSRAGRLLFAVLVTLGGAAVEWGLYRPHGFLYALAACAPLVPWIDRLLPGVRYRWPNAPAAAAAAAAAAVVPIHAPAPRRGASVVPSTLSTPHPASPLAASRSLP